MAVILRNLSLNGLPEPRSLVSPANMTVPLLEVAEPRVLAPAVVEAQLQELGQRQAQHQAVDRRTLHQPRVVHVHLLGRLAPLRSHPRQNSQALDRLRVLQAVMVECHNLRGSSLILHLSLVAACVQWMLLEMSMSQP